MFEVGITNLDKFFGSAAVDTSVTVVLWVVRNELMDAAELSSRWGLVRVLNPLNVSTKGITEIVCPSVYFFGDVTR